jgi:RHS repeat-associated protein
MIMTPKSDLRLSPPRPSPPSRRRWVRSLLLCGLIVSAGSRSAGSSVIPGTSPAQFSVGPDGSATYSIRLRISPGTAGMEPKLALTYSSRLGASSVGYGWSLSGLSSVQRSPKNLSDDGVVSGITFDETDALLMDGERLLETGRARDGSWREYKSRVDSFARIRAYDWSRQGPDRFIVETRAGLRMFYGSTDSSKVRLSSGPVTIWLCDRIEDRSGNYLLFTYDVSRPDYQLLDVRYTGNRITGLLPYARIAFNYQGVEPMDLRYVAGERVETRQLLSEIQSTYGGRVYRRYELTHQRIDDVRKSYLLTAVYEQGEDGRSYNPLTFQYKSSTPGWEEQALLSLPEDLSFAQSADTQAGFRLLDLNGDGRDDVVYRTKLSPDTKAATYVHDGTSWKKHPEWTSPVDLAEGSTPLAAVVGFDADGDGATDLVVSGGRADDGVYLAKPAGWKVIASPLRYRFARGGVEDERYLLMDVDPSKKNGLEILWNSAPQGKGFAHFEGTRWVESPALAPPRPFSVDGDKHLDGVFKIDVDCDGVDELVYHRKLPDGTTDSAVYRYTPGGWIEETSTSFAIPIAVPPSQDAVRIADLDGDGCKDLVVAYEAGGIVRGQAYLASVSGWKQDPRPFPNAVFWRNGAPTGVWLLDLTADGRADLMGWGPAGSPDRLGYRGDAGQWGTKPSFVPPARIQPQGRPLAAGGRIAQLDSGKRPELLYFEGRDPLSTVYSISRAGRWLRSDAYRLPLDIAQFDKVDLGVRFPDLDGNGLADLAFTRKSQGTLTKVAYLYRPWDRGQKWHEAVQFKIPVATFSDDFRDTGVALADFSGDGLTDVLSSYRTTSGQIRQSLFVNCSKTEECRSQTGEGSFWKESSVSGIANEPFADETLGSLGARFTDVNGDGLADLLVSRIDPADPSSRHAATYLNQLGSFKLAPGLQPPIDFVRNLQADEEENLGSKMKDNRVEILDLDGDRLPDLIYHFETLQLVEPEDSTGGIPRAGPSTVLQKVVLKGAYMNKGDHWEPAASYAPPHRIDADDARPDLQVYFEDVNGDSLVDLVYANRGSSETFLNTGRGWSPANPGYKVPDEAISTARGDQGLRFMDVNGDGLVDLTYSYALSSTPSSPAHGTFLNSGVGWSHAGAAYDLPLALTEEYRGDLGVRPLDLDGDGILDLVKAFKQDDGTTKHTAFLNVSGKPDLLVSVANGLGMSTSIEYRSMLSVDLTGAIAGFPVYEPERTSAYPVIDAPVPGYVVTRTRAGAPGVADRTSRYFYGGYRVNVKDGRSLGFAKQSVVDVERNRTTRIEYSQQDGMIGNTTSTEVLQGPRRISRSTQDWETTSLLATTLPNGFVPTIYQSFLSASTSESWDLGGLRIGSQKDSFQYNSQGNPVRILTRFGDNSGSETKNSYGDNLTKWLLGRLTVAEVRLFAPGKPDQIRKARFEYDSETGLLLKEVSLANTPLERVATYARDPYGNKVNVKSTVTATGMARGQKIQFDPQGRFVISSENALRQTTLITTDPLSGLTLEQRDPNGLTTRAEFDSLQQPVSETSPSGVKTTFRSFFLAASALPLRFATGRKVATMPESLTFFDSAGRTREERTLGFQGKTVVSRTEYDVLGRARRTSIPHFEGDFEPWIERKFDRMDRPVMETRPDGSRMIWRYAGLETTAENSSKQKTVSAKDERGRLAWTRDAAGGTTRFSYDAGGNQVAITNALGQVTTAGFDLAGNRTRLSSSDVGTWLYVYDGFSRIVSQEDPLGNDVTIAYDALDRVVRRRAGNEEQVWIYDTAEHGIGALTETTTSTGSQKKYTYDPYGRVSVTDIRFGKDEVSVAQTYDGLSRPSRQVYSTGLTLQNQYDEEGFWIKVEASSQDLTAIAWETTRIDALGRSTGERLGNSLKTTRQYDPKSGRIRKIETLSPSETLQNLEIEYDLIGNVTARADSVAGTVRESFEYDDLNRLTRSHTGSNDVAVFYDALGNITSKSDVGRYDYCQPTTGVQRLCSTTDSQGRSTTLVYDAAGNITRSGTRAIRYSAEGRVVDIRQSSLRYASFDYGTDGEIARYTARDREIKTKSVFLGDVEILREEFAPPFFPTPERTRVRNYIATPSGTIGFYEKTYWHFPMRQASPVYADEIVDKPERTTITSETLRYYLKDSLGSIAGITNIAGQLDERYLYDAWGSRRKTLHESRYFEVAPGYTGHQHLDALGLIHMGGRVYDPRMARFLSADPYVQAPQYSQSHNRYAYVLNNPLRLIDPSGYGIFGDLFDAVGGAIRGIGNAIGDIVDATIGKPLRWVSEQLNKAGHWLSQNWRTVAVIAASVVLSVAVPGLGAIAAGAIIGGLQAALYGGSVQDIMKGAIIGAISGALFCGAGEIGAQGLSSNYVGISSVHGIAGGITAEMNGGEFTTGFATAFLTKAAAPGIEILPNAEARVAAAAVVGGTVSAIGGDSFENGALTGAFSRAFNDESHGARENPSSDEFKGSEFFSYEGDPWVEYSFSGDLSVGSSIGIGPNVSASTGAYSMDIPLGGPFYFNADTQGTYQLGVQYAPPFAKYHPFNFADAKAFGSYASRSGVLGAGASVRVLSFSLQGTGSVRAGPGVSRAAGDLQRNVYQFLCSQGGCPSGWTP